MTSTELRLYRKQQLNDRLEKKYKTIMTRDMPCFINKNGTVFHLESMGNDFNCIVIGYADSLQEAMLCRFEDGDCFYMDELTEDEIFEAMIKEIEVS